MLGLGWSEIFIIVVVALLVIGPDKLPEVLRGTAKVFRQIQRMATDVRQSLDVALQDPPPQRPLPNPGSNQQVAQPEHLAQSAQIRREAAITSEVPPSSHDAGQPLVNKSDSPSQD